MVITMKFRRCEQEPITVVLSNGSRELAHEMAAAAIRTDRSIAKYEVVEHSEIETVARALGIHQ